MTVGSQDKLCSSVGIGIQYFINVFQFKNGLFHTKYKIQNMAVAYIMQVLLYRNHISNRYYYTEKVFKMRYQTEAPSQSPY